MVGFTNGSIDKNDPERTIFLIPENHMPRLEREIAKLSKKAEKWNGWSFGAMIIGMQFRDERDGSKTKLLEVCLDVEPIKIDGWRFMARIDHSNDTGNVLRVVPNATVDKRFRTAAPNCEHCNHKRMRRDTFVLFNEDTGDFKQVGSTCLEDFLGHDAAALGRVAELAGYATELARAIESEPTDPEVRGLNDRRYVDLPEYLSHVAAMVRVNGWVSGKAAYESDYLVATRVTALENMFPHSGSRHLVVQPTIDDVALANRALEWAQGFAEKSDLNDYEHNVLVIANSPVIEFRSTGLAASIVGVFFTKHTPKRGTTHLGDMKPMLALFNRAGSRLKYPKINLRLPDAGDVVLSVAKGGKAPGSINVATPGGFGNNTWFGRINLDGSYAPSRVAPKGIEEQLLKFAADPAGFAAAQGHMTGRCCFCSLPLTDARSTEVGYGRTCADNYGLPWGKKAVA